jgi:hypothetical protein
MRLELLLVAVGLAMTDQSARKCLQCWTSIQQIMSAQLDTKVSSGTFVQLIRILTSGLIKYQVESGWIDLASIE